MGTKDYTDIKAVENHTMPSVNVKLYLSRFDALRELNDNYELVHQNHDDGATSNIIDDNLLVSLIDLDILKSNNPDSDLLSNEAIATLLGIIAHESYHLACRWMEVIGEDHPGEEELAYHVEAISAALFNQLLDYIEKK